MATPADIRIYCARIADDIGPNTMNGHQGTDANIGLPSYNNFLINNIIFHELNFDSLLTAITCLTKSLLINKQIQLITPDHIFLWSWCADLTLSMNPAYFLSTEQELRNLFRTCSFASISNHGYDYEQPRSIRDNNARNFASKGALCLSYLGFPLLEAILRKECPTYLDKDGTVLTSFSTLKGPPYIPNNKQKCSSLGAVLKLFVEIVADSQLKDLLNELLDGIKITHGNSNPYEEIFNWRNQTLHGEAGDQIIGGTIFGISLLIAIYGIKDRFEALRKFSIDACKHWNIDPTQRCFSLYPPNGIWPTPSSD
ncbi:MAG: hypothetical protein EOP48_07150 [Sphingobacteriales bacterium]|nr:MAG: hypothetical protein EOP48_07150 [Sphingobacteriales bacterium]